MPYSNCWPRGGPTPVRAQNPTIPGAIQYPGRAAIFGFPNGGTIPQIRFWLNHGPAALAELTGPNDKQLVGDFRDLGHDQVLFMNYWGSSGRTFIGDFSPPAVRFPGQPEPPRPATGGPLSAQVLRTSLRGKLWRVLVCSTAGTRRTIFALAGDFMNLGYDQVLLINRDEPKDAASSNTGHLMIVDYRGAAPVIRHLESWAFS